VADHCCLFLSPIATKYAGVAFNLPGARSDAENLLILLCIKRAVAMHEINQAAGISQLQFFQNIIPVHFYRFRATCILQAFPLDYNLYHL
jgi:hypothetical protein